MFTHPLTQAVITFLRTKPFRSTVVYAEVVVRHHNGELQTVTLGGLR